MSRLRVFEFVVNPVMEYDNEERKWMRVRTDTSCSSEFRLMLLSCRRKRPDKVLVVDRGV